MPDETTQRPEAIRARAQAAKPGPWGRDGAVVYAGSGDRRAGRYLFNTDVWFEEIQAEIKAKEHGPRDWGADLEFAAHAREDVPWLLAERDRLRAENEALRTAIGPVAAWAEAQLGRRDTEAGEPVPDRVIADRLDYADRVTLTAGDLRALLAAMKGESDEV